ncbi:MAG: hypothetical protein V1484_00555 [bacterium]
MTTEKEKSDTEEQILWQRFQGKSNTDDVLTEKAKFLAAAIMDVANRGVSELIEYFVKDKKVDISKDQMEEVLFETVIFYLHLADRIAFHSITAEQRHFFMSIVLNDIIDIFLLNTKLTEEQKLQLIDTMHATYNERQIEYGNYKKLFSEDGKDGGTLYWEFSDKIANVLVGPKNDIWVMMEVQNVLVRRVKILQLKELFKE